MIYAFLNQKGGVGKTTLSVNVSTALSRLGRRVMLVDADPQGSVLDWSASREDEPLFPVVGLPTKTLHRDIIPHLKALGTY
jgi:chromosome partitioning protein